MNRTRERQIEIRKGMGIDEIHSMLASALSFPDYYGKNWDAFNECFNDDDASNPPERLLILGWDVFISEHLKHAKAFWHCIMERGETTKPMEVLVSPRPCPCCGYLTLSDYSNGSYEICSVCNWEDDEIQHRDPRFAGGANVESLEQARERFNSNSCNTDKIRDFRFRVYS